MPAAGDNLRISGARLWDSLMEMAKIGPGVAGGNNRQTLTDADAEGSVGGRHQLGEEGSPRPPERAEAHPAVCSATAVKDSGSTWPPSTTSVWPVM